MKAGCCVDKSCTPETCMILPAGVTCGTCAHVRRCVTIFGARVDDEQCGWFPRRYREHADVYDKGSES